MEIRESRQAKGKVCLFCVAIQYMKKQEVQHASKEDKNQAYLSLLDVKKNCFDGRKDYSQINFHNSLIDAG